VCLVPESSPPLHSASVQSITDTTGLLGSRAHLSRGLSCTTHTRPLSPRPRTGKLITEDGAGLSDWLRCGGAAWPCSLSQALQADTAVAPTHAPPEKHRLKQGVAVPFLSFVSFLRVWRLTCLNASQSAPQIYRPAHHTSGTPARPVPANKSAGSPSVPRRLKSPAPPRLLPSPPHARPRMSGTLILQPVSTSWLLLPHDHDPKPHPCIFGSTGQGRGAQTVQIVRAPAWDDISIDVCWLIWEIAG
jgi:hypothetical protein